MHEPRAVHRLHHPPHRLAVDRHPAREAVQAVAIRGRRETVQQLPLIRDQAHLNSSAAQIQTHMQHENTPLPARAVAPARPAIRPILFETEGRPPPGGYTASGKPAYITFLREATGPVNSAAIGMYGLHTSGQWSLAEDGVVERDFCKCDEEKCADTSA